MLKRCGRPECSCCRDYCPCSMWVLPYRCKAVAVRTRSCIERCRAVERAFVWPRGDRKAAYRLMNDGTSAHLLNAFLYFSPVP